MRKDPLTGADVEVLWVKGSGGDLGSMKRDGFATLYLDKLLSLEQRLSRPRVMRTRWWRCSTIARSTSTRARLDRHAAAWLRAAQAHVDHVHADAVIAIAAS